MVTEDALKNSRVAVVDFSTFLDGSNKQGVADTIFSSFKEAGFVYILNHGISPEQIAKIFAASKEFFTQPMDVKELARHPPLGTHHRGYSAPGREKIIQPNSMGDVEAPRPAVPDFREHFECGSEESTENPNIWLPDGALPRFKESCLEFFWLCYDVELNILRALAMGMGLEEEYLCRFHSVPDEGNMLRLLYYPSVPAEALRNETVERISAHSDYASITLLLQDDAGGLEIEDPHTPGVFRPVPPIPNALVVNAGDFMKRWSNDTIKSTMHRVCAPPGLETSDGMIPARYSIPFFCGADPNVVVDCIPGTWDAERPKKYEPISAGEYVRKRQAVAYVDH
ncbi:Fe2OG dioxygenase domain-containing protein [Mycena venus]|uniref:Fe2OG dioxygenase domain-containing protein n=1 Tax=Mycena venus TaxID=2733690 RepID=A0A8H6XIX5_9AGAR|nr:Fe2OG dioxygenase domain-containing protein [Mycena venus]